MVAAAEEGLPKSQAKVGDRDMNYHYSSCGVYKYYIAAHHDGCVRLVFSLTHYWF